MVFLYGDIPREPVGSRCKHSRVNFFHSEKPTGQDPVAGTEEEYLLITAI